MQKTNQDKIAIGPKSKNLLQQLMTENRNLKAIINSSHSLKEFQQKMNDWAFSVVSQNQTTLHFYYNEINDRNTYNNLTQKELAAIRILDYIDNSGRTFSDLNLRGQKITNNPFKLLWLAYKKGRGGAQPSYFKDMIYLFRQFSGKYQSERPSKETVNKWMNRYPSGLESEIIRIRKKNKERIISIFIDKLDSGEILSTKYQFGKDATRAEKFEKMNHWWDDRHFHLRFAVRSPELLNEMLGHSLEPSTLKRLYQAQSAGIPFFVNPYYLSLVNVDVPEFAIGADLAIRDYIIYSQQLIEEFGHIVAWECEDIVEPGKPNAAGWILPNEHNIHRRYPEVAILIPDTIGRACGGLCVSCQRMYDFQNGHLNFNLEKLKPKESWPKRLENLMVYFEDDAQLRDILITGGDALMSTDKSLKKILDEVYYMALRKKKANDLRPNGKKYAEMLRIRLGTRLPVYLPQRISKELVQVLKDFRGKARKIGMKQFIIQTHFESPMEVTPEAKAGIKMLLSSGWLVTNQLVFTAAASRRGHTAKLRKVLNDIGVLTYYTFSVKGYKENSHNFATNARAVQEQIEEKYIGEIPESYNVTVQKIAENPEEIIRQINYLRKEMNIPFLATDRNVLNLPGVGKSLTFRTIGITRGGRRILEFDHDATRNHSPIIEKMGKIVIIESKSIGDYLEQLENMGEDVAEYESIYMYSAGVTERRMSLFEYPAYDFETTQNLTNFSLDEDLAADDLVA